MSLSLWFAGFIALCLIGDRMFVSSSATEEECYDLFEPWVTRDQRKKLDIRTDERGQNVVAGLSQVSCSRPSLQSSETGTITNPSPPPPLSFLPDTNLIPRRIRHTLHESSLTQGHGRDKVKRREFEITCGVDFSRSNVARGQESVVLGSKNRRVS